MKKTACYLMVLFTIIVTVTACEKMDSNYRKFIVPGSIIYPGAASTPVAYPGHNRIKISWLKGHDPSVIKARIFWNNYTDSVEITIPSGTDTINVIIDSLPEKTYTFIIKTYDAKGHVSVPVELLSVTYGENYQASLLNRSINSAEIDSLGIVTIQWGAAAISNGAYAVDIKYTDTAGKNIIQRFPIKDSVSTIKDMGSIDTFQYRTVFIPDSLAIDTFYTDYSTQQLSKKTYKIDKSSWIATADSYSSPYYPSNAIDDNLNTFWNSNYRTNPPPFPHWWEVDMGKAVTVASVDMTCRQGYTLGFDFTIEGSSNGVTWTNYGSYTLLPQAATQSFTVVGSPKVRYIKIYQTNPSMDVVPSCFAEFTVYGY